MASRHRRAPSARELAASVVQRPLRGQAVLSDALDAGLSGSGLEPRDRALATELSYGVVRLRGALGRRLDALARRGKKPDPLVESHLLVAAYQLLVLERVPDFAAVSEAVATLKRLRGPRVAAFANAVLRRLAGEEQRLDPREALLESLPAWLSDEIVRSLGGGATGRQALVELLGGSASRGRWHRGLCVRLAAGRDAPRWAADAEPGQLSSSALWLEPRGDLRALEGYADGAFVVQEEGAQWAARALGARPTERVLDACAGHGQKASLIAESLGASGQLVVADVAADKLDALEREFQRLRLPLPERRVVDLAAGTGDLPGDFDRVLVDAPCTGTGTLRRRPEIGLRLEPGDAARLAAQGVAIAANAARLLRPGGRLVYVTCSVLASECERVVERLATCDASDGPRLEPCAFDASAARALAGEATSVHLSPRDHGTDAYFVASFLRR